MAPKETKEKGKHSPGSITIYNHKRRNQSKITMHTHYAVLERTSFDGKEQKKNLGIWNTRASVAISSLFGSIYQSIGPSHRSSAHNWVSRPDLNGL